MSSERDVRPVFWFTRSWREKLKAEEHDAIGKHVASVTRSNVVMHSTSAITARRLVSARLLGKFWPQEIAASPLIEALKSNHERSPFAHFRFTTKKHGKLLCFKTGNCIRAGKHTHGDACRAAFRFQWWLYQTTNGGCSPWPTAVSCPNTVLTGKLKKPPPPGLATDWSATTSSKFPGIALKIPGLDSLTPEVFPKSGKFICPGATSIKSLTQALTHISGLVSKHSGSTAT